MPMRQAPSFAPVAMPSEPPRPMPKKSGAGFLVACILLLVLGAGTGGAIVLAMPDGTLAKIRTALRERTQKREPTNSAGTPARPQERAPAAAPPPLAVEPATVPTVPVDALPKPSIESDRTLVKFSQSADGHRVYVDGQLLSGGGAKTTKMKCGKRTIKIGSAGKGRVVDLPCGGEVTLP
jgi:hypothetical protein